MAVHSGQTKNRARIVTRIIVAVTGVLWFIWIGIEDQSPISVLIMAAIMVLALLTTSLERHFSRLPESAVRRFVVIVSSGLVGGLLVTPVAVLLMAVKVSLHNHSVPDFSRPDVIQVLYSTPAWALGMLMLSAALALYDRIRST
jgi:hypothetical protein